MGRLGGGAAACVATARAAALLLVAVRHARADGPLFASSALVVELTQARFDATVLSSRSAWVVDFYADWCPHCQHFAPIWEDTARVFRGDNRVSFGAVDCAVQADLCGEVKIAAYPSLRVYNLPGVDSSTQKAGVELSELGNFDMNNAGQLQDLLRKKLLAVGPAPKTGGSDADSTVTASPSPGAPAPAPRDEPASASTAQKRLIDAEVALVYALRQGTAVAAAKQAQSPDPEDALALGGEALAELVLWLSFLAKVLPSAAARQDVGDLATVARTAQAGSGVLPRSVWISALDSHAVDVVPADAGQDPSRHWRLCATYTCGLWTMFHMVTVAVSLGAPARRLGAGDAAEALPLPAEAMQRIRGFVSHFFGCEECVQHFTGMYDSCQFGRCNIAPTDGAGTALWLWTVHNNVTHRIAGERGLKHMPEPWPRRAYCGSCWRDAGAEPWDRDAVLAYLREAYIPAEDSSRGAGVPEGWLWLTPALAFVLVLGLAGLAWWACRQVKPSPSGSAEDTFMDHSSEAE